MSKKYTEKGIGEVVLGSSDYVSAGGEKEIYAKGSKGYAIYHDVSKVIPAGKIQELSAITHPHVIKPENQLLNGSKVVGYSMKFIRDPYVLVQLFTKAFKKKYSIESTKILELIKEMFEITSHVHSKSILIVDNNEMNWLVSKDLKSVYAIDTNSWQTPHFPATAIMDSIRDRHAKKFTTGSDWFSGAILAFQLLIGMHPYKGSHGDFEHLPPDQRMEARMLKNVSAFHSKTKMPKVCEPLAIIPPVLKNWMEATFEKGLREAPPIDFEAVKIEITAAIKELIGDKFDIDKIEQFNNDIVRIFTSYPKRVIVCKDKVHIGKAEVSLSDYNVQIGFIQGSNRPIAARIEEGKVLLYDLEKKNKIDFNANCDKGVFSTDGRLYLVHGKSVSELNFNEFGNKVIASAKSVGQVLDVPDATKIYEGVIMQNLLGTWYASIFPEKGQSRQIEIKELKNYRVIDAKYEKGVLVVVASNNKTSKYDRFVFRMIDKAYDVRKVENITPTGINFAVTDHGVAVLMNEDEKVEVFFTIGLDNPTKQAKLTIIDDDALGANIILHAEGSKVIFAQGKTLYSLSIKK